MALLFVLSDVLTVDELPAVNADVLGSLTAEVLFKALNELGVRQRVGNQENWLVRRTDEVLKIHLIY